MTASSRHAGDAPGAVTVRVPATSANLGPGFDSLGLALGLHDEITVQRTAQPGLHIDIEGEGAGQLALDETHLVVRAMQATFDRMGVAWPGVSLRCVNRIPHGRGLGSSAAAIVGGVLAARALADARSEDGTWTLNLASEIEGHPDNVAACLLGGLTVAWTDEGGARAARLEPSPGLDAVVCIPATPVATATARGLLPASVPHSDAAYAAGRAALLVEAISRRPDLLLPATEDRLHQQYRAPAMPQTAALVGRLRAAGLAAVVSGAGPSVLVLLGAGRHEQEHIRQLTDACGGDWVVTQLPVDRAGAQIRRSGRAGQPSS